MSSQPLTFAERAHGTTAYGFPVIPLIPRTKKAFLDGWENLATTDSTQIAAWDRENPNYNCGAVAKEDVGWIFDVDNPAVFARILKDTGHSMDEIDTLVVKSSGEKRHFYFKHDDCSRVMGNRDCDDADGKELFSVRAHNKYVVAAGSIHPDTGEPYEIIHEPLFCEIPVAPPRLIDWIMKQTSRPQRAATVSEPIIIPEGGRDKWLFKQACKLRDDRYPQEVVLTLLQDLNQKCCEPPMSDSVVQDKVTSAFTREPRSEAGGNTQAPEGLNLVSLSSVEAKIQKWLWDNRIPMDALTNISGVADQGKSLVLYDILSCISKGNGFPDGAKNPFGGAPKKVLLMFSEGSLETTVKPRMMVMGANMENIITLKSVSRSNEKDVVKRQFYLDSDLALLREALRANPDIVAIGFDPITNYLGSNCNMNLSQDVRRVLTPLGELAEECHVTVISIIHFSKNTAMNAIHRTGGAAALVEVPRAAWCCTDDPENKGGFVFVRIKNNLGKRVGGVAYRIEETFLTIEGKQTSLPQLVWGKATERTADDLLNLQNNPEMRGVAKARQWLETTFRDGCARRSSDVFEKALAAGNTEDCVKKARRGLLESKKINWEWYMRRRQGQSVEWVFSTDLEDKPKAAKRAGESVSENDVEVF